MALFASKQARNRAIIIQLAIIAGLVAFYLLALPAIKKARARAAAAEREQAVSAFFQSAVVEAPEGEGSAAPKRLRLTPEVQEVEQRLGAPDQILVGYGGAQHLTWVGTRHKLRASFNRGKLYALTMIDLETGLGETAYESSAHYQAF